LYLNFLHCGKKVSHLYPLFLLNEENYYLYNEFPWHFQLNFDIKKYLCSVENTENLSENVNKKIVSKIYTSNNKLNSIFFSRGKGALVSFFKILKYFII